MLCHHSLWGDPLVILQGVQSKFHIGLHNQSEVWQEGVPMAL